MLVLAHVIQAEKPLYWPCNHPYSIFDYTVICLIYNNCLGDPVNKMVLFIHIVISGCVNSECKLKLISVFLVLLNCLYYFNQTVNLNLSGFFFWWWGGGGQ